MPNTTTARPRATPRSPKPRRVNSGPPSPEQIQQLFVVAQPQPFWKRYAELCDEQDNARGRIDKATAEHVTVARVAALTQMLATLQAIPVDALLVQRRKRLAGYGVFKEG